MAKKIYYSVTDLSSMVAKATLAAEGVKGNCAISWSIDQGQVSCTVMVGGTPAECDEFLKESREGRTLTRSGSRKLPQ